MCMRTYVCLLFVNGLIQVTPKAVRTYVHHDRKPVCIAELYVLDYLLHLLYDYYLTILSFLDILYC
jgi:hypothetical protein